MKDLTARQLIKYIRDLTLSCDNITDNDIADALCDGLYLDKLSRHINFSQQTVEEAFHLLKEEL